MKHPIQPLEKDELGTLRFKKNHIVEYLLDNGGIDMNTIARKNFTNEDRQQFAQLIGYSLSGYSELRGYVDDYSYYTAEKMSELKIDETTARNIYLEGLIKNLKLRLREPMAELFEVHPDDLK